MAEREKEFSKHFKFMVAARKAILDTGAKPGSSGKVKCPKCGKLLHYAISELNGHVRAKCDTPCCLCWIE
jgi:hypothetical protein